MTLSDGLLVASASLLGAAATFYASLHHALPRPEYRAFARFTGALAAYVVATAILARAPSTTLAVWVAAASWFVGSMCIGALAEFASAVAEPVPDDARWTYRLFALLSAITVGAALVFAEDPTVALRVGGEWPLNLITTGHTALAFASLARSVAKVVAGAKERPELRRILVGFGLAVTLSALGEVIQRWTGTRTYINEFSGLLTVGASTIALAERQTRLSRELEQTTEQLGVANAQLAKAQKERGRREPLAALGELSAVVAHEVRNPLAIVKNAVSTLRRKALDPTDRATLLAIIGEEAARLSRLVRDLLAFARPRSAGDAKVQVKELVQRAIRDATQGAEEDPARFELHLDGPAAVEGDAELLRLALGNVLSNALHATQQGGKIRVRSCEAILDLRPALQISVEDDGHGMSEEVVAKARDPFFTTRATGTGLGLAIVDRVMRSHTGTLRIESHPGDGTTVELTVPVSAVDRNRATPIGGMELQP